MVPFCQRRPRCTWFQPSEQFQDRSTRFYRVLPSFTEFYRVFFLSLEVPGSDSWGWGGAGVSRNFASGQEKRDEGPVINKKKEKNVKEKKKNEEEG